MVRKSVSQALVALALTLTAAAAAPVPGAVEAPASPPAPARAAAESAPRATAPAPEAAAAAPAEAAAPASAGRHPSPLLPLSDGGEVELPAVDEKVPSPDAVLGYPLGSHFTHWERIQHYLGTLAAASPRVKVWEYGQSYEGRPLELVAISSPENLARLDQLREERLRLADAAGLSPGERERLARRLPLVVWLAYGVHGNESSSSEAAMLAAWALAAGQGEIAALLQSTIVLIDPLVNPDGRERYVHGFEQRRGEQPNPHRVAAEHWEPWPGGRQNHYLIDLNRDWAWATQQESRQRIAAYRAWEPQVYVDFHEMGIDSSYFFPPAADSPPDDGHHLVWTHRLHHQLVAVSRSGRQAEQVFAEHDRLGAKLSCAIGEVDAVSIGEQPIRDNQRVEGRLEVRGRRRSGIRRIHRVPFSA